MCHRSTPVLFSGSLCFLGITHSPTELSAQGQIDLFVLLQQYFGFIDTYTSMSLEKNEFPKHSGYITFPLHTRIKKTHCCQANATTFGNSSYCGKEGKRNQQTEKTVKRERSWVAEP